MSSIFAIGGGEITDAETRPVDETALRAAGGDGVTVLFLPTASGDAPGYVENFEAYFGDELGAETDVLELTRLGGERPPIRSKIDRADAVYVGGGNTAFMLQTWRSLGVDDALRSARDDTVLFGVSAGALCWATGGLTGDAPLGNVEFAPVSGLDLIEDLHLAVHATPERRERFADYLRARDAAGVALEDGAALEVSDAEWRVRTSDPDASAHLVVAEDGAVTVRELSADADYRPLPIRY